MQQHKKYKLYPLGFHQKLEEKWAIFQYRFSFSISVRMNRSQIILIQKIICRSWLVSIRQSGKIQRTTTCLFCFLSKKNKYMNAIWALVATITVIAWLSKYKVE